MKKILTSSILIIALFSKISGQKSTEFQANYIKNISTENLTGDWIVRTIQFDNEGENIIYQQNIQAKLTHSNNEIKGKYLISGLPDFMGKFLFKGIFQNGTGRFEKIKVKRLITPNNIEWFDAESGRFKIVHLKGETFIIGDISDASKENTWDTPTYVLLRKKEFSFVTENEENNLVRNYIEASKISFQAYSTFSSEAFAVK